MLPVSVCRILLWNPLTVFSEKPPKGCILDGKLILDSDFLKKELVKTPHQIDGENVTYHSEETYTTLTQPA